MSLRNIGIVYRKELIDSLRDRRTVISMIVVPLLVMPLLTIGMGILSVTLVGLAMRGNTQGHDPGRRGFPARKSGTPAVEGCAHRSRETGLRRGNLQQTNSRGRGNPRGLRGEAGRRRIVNRENLHVRRRIEVRLRRRPPAAILPRIARPDRSRASRGAAASRTAWCARSTSRRKMSLRPKKWAARSWEAWFPTSSFCCA